MKECPSCGYLVKDELSYCPVCGAKMGVLKPAPKRNVFLEGDIARAEAYASTVLYTKNRINLKECNTAELTFLSIIDKYPSEPKAYVAYVNYMTKYIDRIMNPKKGDEKIYFKDLDGLIDKCIMFLDNASKYNQDESDDSLLQEISRLQSCLESLKMKQPQINAKNKKNKNAYIITIVVFVFFFLLWLIIELTKH